MFDIARHANARILFVLTLGLMAWVYGIAAEAFEIREPAKAPPAPVGGWWTEQNFLPADVRLTARPAPPPRGGAPYVPECMLSNGVRVANAHGVIVDNRTLYQVQMLGSNACEMVPLIRVQPAGERPEPLENAHALIAAISLSAPGVAYSLRHPDQGNALFGPQVRTLRSKAVIVDLMTLAPLVTRRGVTVCAFDGSVLAAEGDGYIPVDRSGLYVVRSGCLLEQRVAPVDVRILRNEGGAAIGLLPPGHAEGASYSGPFPVPPTLNVTPASVRPPDLRAGWVVIPARSPLGVITASASAAETRLAAGILQYAGEEALLAVRALFVTPQGRAAAVVVIGAIMVEQYFSKPSGSALPKSPTLPSKSDTDARRRKAAPADATQRAKELSEQHKEKRDYGDCGPEEGKRLQGRVEDACKDSLVGLGRREGWGTACNAGEAGEVLLWKLQTWQACADARDELNRRCFDGGDAGHRSRLVDALTLVMNCLEIVEGQAQ